MKDPNFTIVESARAGADGYSFPSGHTANAVAILGCPVRFSKNWIVRIVCTVLILLTGLSRMYLGVHTPLDVGVSLVIGAVLVFAIYPLFEKSEEKPGRMYAAMAVLALSALAYVLYVELTAWPADIDAHNLESGIKNGYLILGASLGMLVSCFIEKKYINFDICAKWWQQVLKVVLGLGVILGVKAGLKPVLKMVWDHHILTTGLRYFLIVLFAACVWPRTFKWFAKGCPFSRRMKRVLLGILIAILILALLAGYVFWEATRDTPNAPISTDDCTNPLITPLGTTMLSGHRAGGGIAPENTMMALKNCVESTEYELDIFEFDVHLTADDVPVLLHDSTLDRTSDAAEYFGEEDVDVRSKTFAELKNLNMGAKFKNDDGEMPFADLSGAAVPDDLRIISLDEALTYLEASGDYRYIIEIKNYGETGLRSADILYETFERFGCTDRVVVGTFHNEVTAYLDSTYPDLPRSAGMNECIKFFIYSLLNLTPGEDTFRFVALQIPTTDYTVNLGTSRVVNYAHKNNIAVQYWTINDPAEVARLQGIGADAIMTDVPDQAAMVLVQP